MTKPKYRRYKQNLAAEVTELSYKVTGRIKLLATM